VTCRTCKHLDVAPRKDGKIVPRKGDTYNCLAPFGEPPPVPFSAQLRWPPNRHRMHPGEGIVCPSYGKRETKEASQ
jgi:hypothetical protein